MTDDIQDRTWSRRKRDGWWVKYAALPAAVAGTITLANLCGGRLFGFKTADEAKLDHEKIELKIENLAANEEVKRGELKKEVVDVVTTKTGEIREDMREMNRRLDVIIRAVK